MKRSQGSGSQSQQFMPISDSWLRAPEQPHLCLAPVSGLWNHSLTVKVLPTACAQTLCQGLSSQTPSLLIAPGFCISNLWLTTQDLVVATQLPHHTHTHTSATTEPDFSYTRHLTPEHCARHPGSADIPTPDSHPSCSQASELMVREN